MDVSSFNSTAMDERTGKYPASRAKLLSLTARAPSHFTKCYDKPSISISTVGRYRGKARVTKIGPKKNATSLARGVQQSAEKLVLIVNITESRREQTGIGK